MNITGNPWFSIGTTLLSFGLQALTAPKQKREWTGQDALLYDLKKRYTEIRERREAAITLASSISGKPRETYMGLAGFMAVREPLQGKGELSTMDVAKESQKQAEVMSNPYSYTGFNKQPTSERIQEQKKQVQAKEGLRQDLQSYERTGTTGALNKKKSIYEPKDYENKNSELIPETKPKKKNKKNKFDTDYAGLV